MHDCNLIIISALRNILLMGNYRDIKIADFGLSHDNDICPTATDALLSSRWMAVEILQNKEYNTKADVWSMGVVFWEIWSFGSAIPYESWKVDNATVKSRIIGGERLDRPRLCPAPLQTIMEKCWQWNPDDRPQFDDVDRKLQKIAEFK
jgi:serine/threonine protein kinase